MTQRARFPGVTGPRAGSHRDAAVLQRDAQDQKDRVNSDERAAALRNPGTDTSCENAERKPFVGGFDQIHGIRRHGAT